VYSLFEYTKICDILVFIAKSRVKRGYFPKVSTAEIPVSTGPVDFLNRSGPVPALHKIALYAYFSCQSNIKSET
jgi:hypothetical protein